MTEQIEQQHREATGSTGGLARICGSRIESDILVDGSLDYPDDVLDSFDFVVASIHSRLKLDKKAQTERLLRAGANPYKIIGHMTGRQLQRRQVTKSTSRRWCAPAKNGVAVEINAHPCRLDLAGVGTRPPSISATC
nr:hypothetical protein [Bradyrhizobium altum]